MRHLFAVLGLVVSTLAASAATPIPPAAAVPPVRFNTAFESGSLGKIEKLGETEFRVHLKGQQDARGRNRQATWFLFRMDDVSGREVTLHLASWKGEYNDRPARSPTGEWFRPVFSVDGVAWQHVAEATWDEGRDEITLTLRPQGDILWVAHVPPYSYARLESMLTEIRGLPQARVEVIGKSVLGRDLHQVTITNLARPDSGKKVIWMQARQHAWEAGTSFLLEGALRCVLSDDPGAQKLRDENIFIFIPMINPDSVVLGEVRFNVNGFDPNRQWDEVDLRDSRWLERNPEIWYVKKAILAQQARQPIAIALNLHNTEMNEYLDTMVDAEPQQSILHRFFALAVQRTSFDPSRPQLTVSIPGSGPGNTTNVIWREAGVPMMLLEQRIGPSRKLNRIATSADRMTLGRELITLMAEVVR